MKYVLWIVSVFVALAVIYYLFTPIVEIKDDKSNSFVINKPFKQVVLSLAKDDVFDEIVKANGGRILKKQKSNEFHIDKIMKPEWHIEGYGVYLVEFKTPYKTFTVNIHEQMQGSKNRLETTTYSVGGNARFQTHLQIEPDGEGTRVTTRNFIVIRERIPASYLDQIRKNVVESNDKSVQNTENCIRKACQSGIFTIKL